MNCSIISNHIGITLNADTDADSAAMAGASQSKYSSALQNPDLSRLQLKTIMRRRARAISSRARKHFWSTLLKEQGGRSAND